MNKEASAQAQMEFNLSVLQRMDKNIISVLFTSKHVTLYILDEETQAWVIFFKFIGRIIFDRPNCRNEEKSKAPCL